MRFPSKPSHKLSWLWPAVPLLSLVALMVAIIALYGSPSLQFVATTTSVNLIIVIGIYTFIGNSGVISFGHLGFVAIGAYGTAILTIPTFLKEQRLTGLPTAIIQTEMGTLPAVVIGGLLAAVFAALVAVPLGRLAGLPAGIATLSVLVIVNVVVSNAETVTGGQSVLVGVPLDLTLLRVFPFLAGVVILASIYQHSASGLRLRASREDSVAAIALGINVALERRIALIVSAFICGIGGGIYGHVQGAFDPTAFYIGPTALLIVMLVVGGSRSLTGAVVGTIVVSIISEILRQIQGADISGPLGQIIRPGFQPVCLGLLFLVTLILRPRGLTNDREIPTPSALRSLWSNLKSNPKAQLRG